MSRRTLWIATTLLVVGLALTHGPLDRWFWTALAIKSTLLEGDTLD
jgi:hypothetical protein